VIWIGPRPLNRNPSPDSVLPRFAASVLGGSYRRCAAVGPQISSMKRNCADSCASCARNAAIRAGVAMANSSIAAVRKGNTAALFEAGKAGMIACSCSGVSMVLTP
jgi:hypothetical protein